MKLLLTTKQLCDMEFFTRLKFLNYCKTESITLEYVDEKTYNNYYRS